MPDQGQNKRKGGRGGGQGSDKANKKARYHSQSKGGSGQAIPHTSRGILVTCDAGREDRAGDEAVVLIEEHYDKLAAAAPPAAAAAPAAAAEAGSAKAGDKDGAAGSGAGAGAATEAEAAKEAEASDTGAAKAPDAEDDKAAPGGREGGGREGSGGASKDIAALLAEEVAQLKDKKTRRFKVHQTGVKGCIYVVFPGEAAPGTPGPVEVARAIAQEAQERKQVRGRHIVRFLPVTSVCFASMDEIKAAAPKLLAGHFPEGDGATPVEFAVEYEHRSAEGFDRLQVINAFTDAIQVPPHKVNLKTPAKVVLVQLIRNGCGMAVVEGYRECAKFNVRKLAEVEEAGDAA